MKKITIGLMATMLVLCIAQGAMAKIDATVGLTLGYENRGYLQETKAGAIVRKYDISAFLLGLSGKIYFLDRFSAAVDGSVLIGKWDVEGIIVEATLKSWFNIGLYARYDVLVGEKYKLGVQAGASYDMLNLGWDNSIYSYTSVFMSPGIFGEIELLPKLKLAADVKLPIGAWFSTTEDKNANGSYFFKLFLYEAKLALVYEVMPNINVGIEGKINNMNAYRMQWYGAELKSTLYTFSNPLAWSVGLKLEYKF